ncbi:MAG: hypothetical protein RL134_1666 [Actinomycetota bacterium]|jgi:Fe-S cluster biogenesis protein NfuA
MADDEVPQSFDELAQRVDELRDRVSHEEPRVKELLDETLDAITAFNRVGLVTLIQKFRSDPRGQELLFEAVDDPEVMALFAAHGLVRQNMALEVLRAVEQIRPYLVASSIEFDVDRVEGDVAYVRFATGCSAPSDSVKDEIRGTLLARVPGLRGVEEVAASNGETFIALDTIRIGAPPS